MKLLEWLLVCFTGVLLAMWMIGNVLSDKTSTSQWFEWIPTVAVLITLLCSTLILGFYKSKALGIGSAIFLVATSVWYTTIENRFFQVCDATGPLRIVGWTMSHPKLKIASESASFIIDLDADVTLMTHGWYVRGEESIKEWLKPNGKKVTNGPFTLLTKLNPIEVTTLVASGSIHISSFTLDATEQLGRHIVIWAVDLPSEFAKPRYKTAMIASLLLDEIEASQPDIVVGDFNMTRNSAAIKYLFPKMQDACDSGGCGLLASYPRAFPLYHIDHILLNKTLQANQYKLINPHVGRHRVQFCELSNIK